MKKFLTANTSVSAVQSSRMGKLEIYVIMIEIILMIVHMYNVYILFDHNMVDYQTALLISKQ